MATTAEVIIVGGGIWGLSTAYQLRLRGVRPVVLERQGELASETTPRAAGLVGQIRANRVMTEAIAYCLDLLEDFKEKTGHDPGLTRHGALLVAFGEERLAAFETQAQRAKTYGVRADFVTGAEAAKLAPIMDVTSVRGALFIPGDGYLDARTLALAYGDAALDLGADIRVNVAVTSLLAKGNKIVGVETNAGRFESDRVVLAAGPWTLPLAQQLGLSLPAVAIRHQRARTVPVPGLLERQPVVRIPDLSCYVRPEQGALTYGFFDPQPTRIDIETLGERFTTSDLEPPVSVLEEARRRLTPLFPSLGTLEVAERLRGLTTFAPDGQYVLGPVGIDGLLVATGCAALGIAGSAAVGRWLAGWLVDDDPGDDLKRFLVDRFGAKANDPKWIESASVAFAGNYYGIAAMTGDE